jgi:hypothetical protein
VRPPALIGPSISGEYGLSSVQDREQYTALLQEESWVVLVYRSRAELARQLGNADSFEQLQFEADHVEAEAVRRKCSPVLCPVGSAAGQNS